MAVCDKNLYLILGDDSIHSKSKYVPVGQSKARRKTVEEKECDSQEKRLVVIVVSIQAIQFPVDGSGFILS